MEAAINSIATQLKAMQEEAKKEREHAQKRHETVVNEMQAMSTKLAVINELQDDINSLKKENSEQRAEIQQLKLQVDLQDQYQKSKNLILYGLPGHAGEDRSTSEAIVQKVFSKVGVRRNPVLAHRLSQKQDSPMLVQFNSKQDAQEIFLHLRRSSNLNLESLALGSNGKVEVRYHLSTHLSELLRSANLLRREAGWAYCRPLTSTQCVELFKTKEPNSPKVTVRNLIELVDLKDSLLKDGFIATSSPANQITTERPLRKRPNNMKGNPPKKTAQ